MKMEFYIIDKEIKIKEETLDYMAEMMENAKWSGKIIFDTDDKITNSYEAVGDRIYLNIKNIREKAEQTGRDPELQMLSTFGHELFHAVDPSKEMRGENELKMMEHIYQDTSNFMTKKEVDDFFDGINKLEKKVVEEIIISEAKTNNALDFFPKSHPKLQELKRTFIESNIQSNQTYMGEETKIRVKGIANDVFDDKTKGIPLEEQRNYKNLKNWQNSMEENHKKTFNPSKFEFDKKLSIKLAIEDGTLIERMEPKAKMKEQTFEKAIKVKMVKEELQLSKTTSLTKEEVTISRAYTIATETIKEKTKSFIKEKAVEVFRNIQQSFKQLKEKVSSKQKTNEHTL